MKGRAAVLPDCLVDFVAPDSPARVIDALIDELDAADEAEAGERTASVAAHPERIARLRAHMQKLDEVEAKLDASELADRP